MKRAFTLVELLIVVTVIAILMGIVMRFAGVDDNARKRNLTVARLQRLENAVSGYYAAFGTYPPVRVQGSRNIYRAVSDHGIQSGDSADQREQIWGWVDQNGKVTNASAEQNAWSQVQSACEAQPVACNYPYPGDDAYKKYVEMTCNALKLYVEQLGQDAFKNDEQRRAVLLAGFDVGDPNRFNNEMRMSEEWGAIQIFRFGLLSFLLPRYLFMMQGPEEFLEFAQWTDNNKDLRNPLNNAAYNWRDMRRDVEQSQQSTDPNDKQRHLTAISSLSSQAVCARWMANFENSLTCAREMSFYGVNVRYVAAEKEELSLGNENLNIKIYSPGGYKEDSHAGQYVLDGVTMTDGWNNDFYYYSPSPHQTYVIWSAGPNGRTFPPWIPRESLSEDANRCVGYWINDDIVGLRR